MKQRPPYIYVHQGSDGKWYWAQYAKNGKITQDGGEGYATKWNCKRAATKPSKALEIPIVYER